MRVCQFRHSRTLFAHQLYKDFAFMVGEDGVVYQKDLGKNTNALAKAMKEYNPNSIWQKAVEQQEETATQR